MKRNTFKDEHITQFLKEYEAGISIADLARICGFAERTLCTWNSDVSPFEDMATISERSPQPGTPATEMNQRASRRYNQTSSEPNGSRWKAERSTHTAANSASSSSRETRTARAG